MPVDDPVSADAGVPTTTPPGPCKYPDTALRLCLEFEDQKYGPTISDTSASMLQVTADDLGHWPGRAFGTHAAGSYLQTDVHVAESAMLDITKEITFELWLALPGTPYVGGTIFENTNQYGLTVDSSGRATCRVGSATAQSAALARDTWHHIACRYADDKLSMYLNGVAVRCEDASSLPTNGTSGTRIMRTLFNSGYTGAIDDIRVYARKLDSQEICTHADKSACSSSCD
jgi:hypothetical protein